MAGLLNRGGQKIEANRARFGPSAADAMADGRPLDLQLPALNSVHDVIAAMAKITAAMNNGDVTAEEAADLVQWFEGCAKVFMVHDLAARIEALEKRDDLGPTRKITRSNHSI